MTTEEEQRKNEPMAAAPPDEREDVLSVIQDEKLDVSMKLLRDYGMFFLPGALSEKEQAKLFEAVQGKCKGNKGMVPENFYISSSTAAGGPPEPGLHVLSAALYERAAAAFCSRLTEEQRMEMTNDRLGGSLKRVWQVHTKEKPADIAVVTGVSYHPYNKLSNHTDTKGTSLYTMSVALGAACDFTVGKKTPIPHKWEKSGTPITFRMRSGDAMFFDGGCVPHAVDGIHSDEPVPDFFKKTRGAKGARISVLFRENLGV